MATRPGNPRKDSQPSLGLRLGIFSVIFGICTSVTPARSESTAIGPDPLQLVRQAQGDYTTGDLDRARTNLTTAAEQFAAQSEWQPLAATLTNLGRVQYATGQLNVALETWERAATLYRDRLDNQTAARDLQILQAEALKELGLYPRACRTLTQALVLDSAYCNRQAIAADMLATMPSPAGGSPMELTGWRDLGTLLRELGRLEESEMVLAAQIERWPTSTDREASLVSLGLTLEKLADRERDRLAPQKFNYLPWRCEVRRLDEASVKLYERAEALYAAAAESGNPLIQAQARLNRLALVANRRTDAGLADAATIFVDFQSLPPGRSRIYARLQAAKSRACLQQLNQLPISWAAFTREIETAIQDARTIGDRRAESTAWGRLGELYELLAASAEHPTSWQAEEQRAIEQALLLAEAVQADDLIYQWQWHLGRIYRARGEKQQAIATYAAAVGSLDRVRGDLLAVDADVQFSFRDNVEPLYRELVNLLVPSEAEAISLPQEKLQQVLASALYYVESLQVAELENFLLCDLLNNTQQASSIVARTSNLQAQIDRVFTKDTNAALLYPILLEDRIAVIVRTPDGQFHTHSVAVPAADATAALDDLLIALREPFRLPADIQQQSAEVYSWLIAPLEQVLAASDRIEASQLQTLVFVLDGPFRGIPMAALYDPTRQHYLLERYAVTQVSGMQLLETAPRSQGNVLIAGLGVEATEFEGNPGLPALPGVTQEVTTISDTIPGDILQDEELVRQNLEKKIGTNPYSIVHIATHGQFSSDPNNTFLLLYDGLLKAREFDRLLQNNSERAIELLVLSACETATGDKRAALGLAGVALRAGARSTLATLWQVDDESTATLMGNFYQELVENPDVSKAEALRRVQLQILQNPDRDWQQPFYWAPYTLLGSWR
ncbi:MAG: CHAT domain-containing protein [Cyanobacteria bacterium J06641_5]